MKREVLGWLIATGSGHGEVTDTLCKCGQRRVQLHSFSCRLGSTHRILLQCKKMSFNLRRSWEAPKVWPFLRSGHLLLGFLTGITGTQTGRNRVLWIERKYIFNYYGTVSFYIFLFFQGIGGACLFFFFLHCT